METPSTPSLQPQTAHVRPAVRPIRLFSWTTFRTTLTGYSPWLVGLVSRLVTCSIRSTSGAAAARPETRPSPRFTDRLTNDTDWFLQVVPDNMELPEGKIVEPFSVSAAFSLLGEEAAEVFKACLNSLSPRGSSSG